MNLMMSQSSGESFWNDLLMMKHIDAFVKLGAYI
jgi:hypothetical protein